MSSAGFDETSPIYIGCYEKVMKLYKYINFDNIRDIRLERYGVPARLLLLHPGNF